MTLIEDWIGTCTECLWLPGRMAGDRKILSPYNSTFTEIEDDLTLGDAGYTKTKLTLLKKLYQNQESLDVATELWEKRLKQGKYGSVGFSTYNHLIKNDPDKKSRIASVMGPCIQAVTLTYNEWEKVTEIDAFYRTTEILKKFPADLVFIRDELLPHFNFDGAPIKHIRFHFANVTVHPMYFAVLIPHLDDPCSTIDNIQTEDAKFAKGVIKWTARYLIPAYRKSIENYSQGMSVYKTAQENIDDEVKGDLIKYLTEAMEEYK